MQHKTKQRRDIRTFERVTIISNTSHVTPGHARIKQHKADHNNNMTNDNVEIQSRQDQPTSWLYEGCQHDLQANRYVPRKEVGKETELVY